MTRDNHIVHGANGDLLRYSKAAELLNMSVPALRNLVRRQMVPFLRLAPRTVRFDPAQLTAWLSERAFYPGSDGGVR